MNSKRVRCVKKFKTIIESQAYSVYISNAPEICSAKTAYIMCGQRGGFISWLIETQPDSYLGCSLRSFGWARSGVGFKMENVIILKTYLF